MSLLIHATITISGDGPMRSACEARLRRLLAGLYLKNEVAEHHGNEALCYDLKIEGGIPFPLFSQASQEFPDLTFEAAWVNIAAGESGSATIVNGRVTGQKSDRIASEADDHPVHVEVGRDGRLRLALVLSRATGEEWRGYAVTADRDALLRARRLPRTGDVELLATEGAPEWSVAWRGPSVAQLVPEPLATPIAIDEIEFRELDALARDFAGRWIWFENGPRAEIAVEADRYARYGYPVSAANVRAARLHRMRAEAGEAAPVVHSTLSEDDRWVKELVLAAWAKESVTRDS
jgi:hypothetical protein